MHKQTIEQWMTRGPKTLGKGTSLKAARDAMHEIGARHIPVLDGGKLLGILSERDVLLAEKSTDVTKATCGDWCIDEPFVVDVDTSITTAAGILAEKRIGSLLVMQEGKMIGIFTTTDACRALASLQA